MRIVAGLASTLFGSLWLIYVYAHARMVNPELSAEERRARIAEKMFLQSGIAEATYIGIILIACGLILVLGHPRLLGRGIAEPVAAPDPAA